MLNKEIREKTMKDLGIGERRAGTYAKMFAVKFGGNARAITDIVATYTSNGDVEFSYIINNNRYSVTIDGNKPYSKKKKI